MQNKVIVMYRLKNKLYKVYKIKKQLAVIGLTTAIVFGCGKQEKIEPNVASPVNTIIDNTVSDNNIADNTVIDNKLDDSLVFDINDLDSRVQIMTYFVEEYVEKGIYYDINKEDTFTAQIESTYDAMIKLNIKQLSIKEIASIYSDKATFRDVNASAWGFLGSIYNDIRYNEEIINLDSLASKKTEASSISEVKERMYKYFNNDTSENRQSFIDYLTELTFNGNETDSATFEVIGRYIDAFNSKTRNVLTKKQSESLRDIMSTTHIVCDTSSEKSEVEIGSITESMLTTLESGEEKYNKATDYAIEQNYNGTYNLEIKMVYDNIDYMIKSGKLIPGKLHTYEDKLEKAPTGGSTLPAGSKKVGKDQYVSDETIAQNGGSIEQYEANQKAKIEKQLEEENAMQQFNYADNKYAKELQDAGITTQDGINNYDARWNTGYDHGVKGIAKQATDEAYINGYNAGVIALQQFKKNNEQPTYENADETKTEIIESGTVSGSGESNNETYVPQAPTEETIIDETVIEQGEYNSTSTYTEQNNEIEVIEQGELISSIDKISLLKVKKALLNHIKYSNIEQSTMLASNVLPENETLKVLTKTTANSFSTTMKA